MDPTPSLLPLLLDVVGSSRGSGLVRGISRESLPTRDEGGDGVLGGAFVVDTEVVDMAGLVGVEAGLGIVVGVTAGTTGMGGSGSVFITGAWAWAGVGEPGAAELDRRRIEPSVADVDLESTTTLDTETDVVAGVTAGLLALEVRREPEVDFGFSMSKDLRTAEEMDESRLSARRSGLDTGTTDFRRDPSPLYTPGATMEEMAVELELREMVAL
jgi:hypothetical protein